jgi:hypothetical protein
MARQGIEVETKKLMESIKVGEFHLNKSKVLIEDLNSQILLAMEVREAARKIRAMKIP